jgi:hypothetical protein
MFAISAFLNLGSDAEGIITKVFSNNARFFGFFFLPNTDLTVNSRKIIIFHKILTES